MKPGRLSLASLLALSLANSFAGCGETSSAKYQGTPPPQAVAFGECAFCHPRQAQEVLPAAGDLHCVTCHEDRRPGFAGPGHRSLPSTRLVPAFPPTRHNIQGFVAAGSCTYCHADLAGTMQESSPELRCSQCHVQAVTAGYGRGHRSTPGTEIVPSPAPNPHHAGDLAPWGKCALCHSRQAVALAGTVGATAATACDTCHQERDTAAYGVGHATRPGPATVPEPATDPHILGAEASWGECGLCHNKAARSLEALLGAPQDLTCTTCHATGTVTGFGPGHRRLPGRELVPDPPPSPHAPSDGVAFGPCALCHQSLSRAAQPVATALTCEVCHAATTQGYFGPRHRSLPAPDLVPAFLGKSHALGDRKTFSSCAYCHVDLVDAVRENGGETLGCVWCHDQDLAAFGPGHRSIPTSEGVPSFVGLAHGDPALRSFGTCSFCHRSVTEQGTRFTHGPLPMECERCHQLAPATSYGSGHATIAACTTCHGTARRTHHDPAEGSASECAVCHDPHGSDNLSLIARQLRTPAGNLVSMSFDNLSGLADGSFASSTAPGSGLCEVCHSQTRFFRSDGSGEPHFTFPCFPCHPHRLGFSVRP